MESYLKITIGFIFFSLLLMQYEDIIILEVYTFFFSLLKYYWSKMENENKMYLFLLLKAIE